MEESSTDAGSKNLKHLNVFCYAVTSVVVLGYVLFGVREEGVYADPYLWMKYQSLLTPANYVNAIWIAIFATQGLFIYASVFHPKYSTSSLVGYNNSSISTGTTLTTLKETLLQSPAANYPAICATTLLTVLTYDAGHVFLALLSSLLCLHVSVRVVKMQAAYAEEMDTNTQLKDVVEEGDEDPAHPYSATHVKVNTFLCLPFELFAGYSLVLAWLYFNVALDRQLTGMMGGMHLKVLLVSANLSLVVLLGIGVALLWKTKRHYYGVNLALIWYMVGVAVELHEPSQPIDNEYSDNQIVLTQGVAGLSATILAAVLSLRVVKTIIKNRRLYRLPCGSLEDSASGDMQDGENGIATDYVQA